MSTPNWPSESYRWIVRMLGRYEVVGSDGLPVRFRSKTAASLFAYLCLHKDRDIPRFDLEQLFWPDSDGDRQAQNLRRTVSDLRDALEDEGTRGSVVQTVAGGVRLVGDRLAIDVARLLTLTEGDSQEESALTEAVSLYAGPLLISMEEPWVIGHRMEAEERFGQAVIRLAELLRQRGATAEALRIGRAAVLCAPLREDVHIALIETYARAGMGAEAIRQYEALERILDETWGEPPSERARQALEPSTSQEVVHASGGHEGPETEPAGGAMPLGSKFYVRRLADAEAEQLVERREGVILVQGPRQAGKSSLLSRVLAHAETSGATVILSDLQGMGESQLADADRFYRTMAHSLATQLGLEVDLEMGWSQWLGPNMNLDATMLKLLEQHGGHVCWGIDEADLLFDRTYTNDFFGLLRSWHNRRALSPRGPWSRLTLILTYATEAHLFITDLNQSPFNVGVRIGLEDFTEAELKVLQSRYSNVAGNAWEVVHQITHGHPYLSRRAFAFLARGATVDALRGTASLPDGPFGDHLNRMLLAISRDSEMVKEVKRLLRGEAFDSPTTRYRLWSSGIISVPQGGVENFRVPAYEPYLRSALG